jgi:hypothetical protein
VPSSAGTESGSGLSPPTTAPAAPVTTTTSPPRHVVTAQT